jgi:hypothetical protein
LTPTTVDVTIVMTYFMWHPSVPKITAKIHIRVMNCVEGSFAKTVPTRNVLCLFDNFNNSALAVTSIPVISALLSKCTANVGSVTLSFATIKTMNAHRLATLVTLHTCWMKSEEFQCIDCGYSLNCKDLCKDECPQCGVTERVHRAGSSQYNPIVLIDDETLASSDNEEVLLSHPWDDHEHSLRGIDYADDLIAEF